MSRLRIVVMGYIVRGPIGGLAWHHLQYVVGLHQLGHDVYFLEDSDDYPSCYDPARGVVDCDPTYGLSFCGRVFDRFGLNDRWAYYDAHTGSWLGAHPNRTRDAVRSADLLLNLSSVNPLRSWVENTPARALIDTDPVFTQVRHLTNSAAMERARQHLAFLTFGESIPAGSSCAPDDGLPWQATRQPVVLDAWPVTPGPATGKFTAVMQWDSYPAVEYAGRRYGMKSESFEPFVDLPAKIGDIFELALGSPTAPRDQLRQSGWTLVDPLTVTRDPWTYQKYLQQSRGEFGVAKHGYVVSHSGWFSERSAGYLASGRPCLLQDTGFPGHIPTGNGLFAFGTVEDVVDGLAEIERRYDYHCQAARALAEECFDAKKVLPRLIEAAHAAPSA